MTREEAADLLDNLIGMVEDNQENDYDEALKMAIEALNVTDTNVGDTIRRQAAITAVLELDVSNRVSWKDAVIDALDALPSVQPKKGHWIYGENDCQDGWFCSACGFFIPWDYDYYGLNNINFIKEFHVCPHCKAEMVTYTGKKEDTDE